MNDISIIIFKYKHQLEYYNVIKEMKTRFFCGSHPLFSQLYPEYNRDYNPNCSNAKQIRIDYSNYHLPHFNPSLN